MSLHRAIAVSLAIAEVINLPFRGLAVPADKLEVGPLDGAGSRAATIGFSLGFQHDF